LDSKSSATDDTQINLEVHGQDIKSQTEVANLCVDYFANVANCVADSRILFLTEEELEDPKSVMDTRSRKRIVNGPTFQFRMLKESEVKESLAALNPNKSTGHDKISPKLLRRASNEFAPSLTDVLKTNAGQRNGKEESGSQPSKKMTTKIRKTIDQLRY